MLLHGTIENSAANGPGNRAVLWFQGCTLNCPGCHNPGSHSFDAEETDIVKVMQWLRFVSDVEGITFSGGEPMQHVEDLARLLQFLRLTRPDLSIGMFTGYTLRELSLGKWHYRDGNGFAKGCVSQWEDVRKHLDFAIMGRYNGAKATSSIPLCGSSNQTIELFSERYTRESFSQQIAEVTITDELVQITGFPGLEFLTNVSE
jgi:anaerobic ribonucleoside-triphosphate reductase activating protein